MLKHRILSLSLPLATGTIVVRPTLVRGDGHVLLCDAGYPGQSDQIERELRAHGFGIEDLTGIVVTHHDHDHVGSLASIRETSNGALVYAEATEADMIDGTNPSLRLLQAEKHNEGLTGDERESGEQFVEYLRTVEPCTVDRRIAASDEWIVPGLRVVRTPGHTPGHISLYLEETRVLIAGDALALDGEKLVIPNTEFAMDGAACLRSVEILKGMAIDTIVCYHGGAVTGDIPRRLDELTEFTRS
jgi:glyoxylase-like metal-dependent hydrolase (beta-lactamase superfamily II)